MNSLPPPIRLHLLSAPRLERNGEPVVVDRRKAVALLAYLVLSGRPHLRDALATLSASVYQFQWPQMQALANMVDRTMDVSVTITDGSAYVATAQGECEISVRKLL